MIELENIVVETQSLCKEVGKFIQAEAQNFSRNRVHSKKSSSDLVSYVDKESEQKIVIRLQELIPGCGFITEEDTPDDTSKEYTWIIDPLDGTTNFVHGLPTYAISIGLMHKSELVAGIVYELNRDEMFYAWKNGGAFLNGKKIKVSPVSSLKESLLSTGFPYYNFEKMEQYLAILNSLMKTSHGLRRVGSAATDLAYVACGRYEGFFEYNLNPYDVAAGIVIVQEAGGVVTDFQGGDNYLFGRELVAGGKSQAELLKVIQEHWK